MGVGNRAAGRPKIQDGEQILGFIAVGRAQGKTLTEATKDGLRIARQRLNADGKPVLDVDREISSKTLSRRCRAESEFLKSEFIRMSSAFRQPGARLIGISARKPT